MAVETIRSEVKVGPQGRILIPTAIRKALGFKQGDRLVVRSAEGGLVLERRDLVENQLWHLFKVIPEEVNLADELINERRLAAAILG